MKLTSSNSTKKSVALFVAGIATASLYTVALAVEIVVTEPVNIFFRAQNVVQGSCVASGNTPGASGTQTGGYVANPDGSANYEQTWPLPGGYFPGPGSYSVTVTCTGAPGSNQPGASISGTTNLTVNPADVNIAFGTSGNNPLYTPTTLSFTSSNPDGVVEFPGSTVLTWNYDNAESGGSCTASNNEGRTDWSGALPKSGSKTLASKGFYQNVTFTINCTAPNETPRMSQLTVVFYEKPEDCGTNGNPCN